jgi:hypothetical protein
VLLAALRFGGTLADGGVRVQGIALTAARGESKAVSGALVEDRPGRRSA